MSEQSFRDKYYQALETQISHLKTINELTEKIDILQKECDLKGQQIEELNKRVDLQARKLPSPINKSPGSDTNSLLKATGIKCSSCINDIDDELKADPFFTGVYKCQDCRRPKPYNSSPKNSPPKLNSPPKAFQSPGKVLDSPLKSFHSPSSAFESNPSPVQKLERMVESKVTDTSVPIQVTATPAPIQVSTPAAFRNETISQYEVCKSCAALFTEGSWAPKGTMLCKKCFRAQTGSKGVMNRTCNQCNAASTSKWYSDRYNIGAHICKSCYSKRRTMEKLRSTCNQCKTDKSIRWYLDSFDISKRLCLECFENKKKPKISQVI
ncbi:hypothetical protein HK103_005114 [Boothiomyces macroporosus]|uniref:GATA-type domain-containing protein n=1 Tax=Boothiomyces macroporosus TaxID=261099 RepID=A0AAD5UG74_9FUNG|nr:hypothetical protein HK103_005114 [Boothiomyces macroporosus]